MLTTAEIEAYLGITYATYSSLIDILLAGVYGEIESYVGHKLRQDTYTDQVIQLQASNIDLQTPALLDIRRSYGQVVLQHYPVSSVTISQDGTNLTVDQDYTLDTDTGIITFWTKVNDHLDKLKVTYTGGYSTANIPGEIKLVALQGLKYEFEKSAPAKQGTGRSVKSKTVGDFSVSYEDDAGPKGYITDNKHILDSYKYVSI